MSEPTTMQPGAAEAPPTTRLELPEQFRFDCCHEFRRSYQAAGPDGRFVLDLGRTREIDTAALGMLLQLEERANQDPQRLRIVNASAELRHLLEIAGLSSYF